MHGDLSLFNSFDGAYSVDLLSVSAKGVIDAYGKILIRAVEEKGCNVRLLLADPANPIWSNSKVSEGLCPGHNVAREVGDTKDYLELLIQDLRQRNPSPRRGSFEVRAYPYAPTCSIIIVNESVLRHTPYLPTYHSDEVPGYDVTKRQGDVFFVFYKEVFEKVWHASSSNSMIKYP